MPQTLALRFALLFSLWLGASSMAGPQDTLVVYRLDRPGDDALYAVRAAPGAIPRLLTEGTPGEVEHFSVSPDGKWAVFLMNDGGDIRMYSRDTRAAGPPILLTPEPMMDWQRDNWHLITPGSDRVIYLRPIEPFRAQVRSVPIDGSEPSVRLDYGGFPIGALQLPLYTTTPNGEYVIYKAQVSGDLFRSPLDGSTPRVQINTFESVDRGMRIRFSPDGERVAYSNGAGRRFTIPLEEGQRAIISGRSLLRDVQFTSDSSRVVYQEGTSLWRKPATGGVALELSHPQSIALAFDTTSDGQIVYENVDTLGRQRLYRTETDLPQPRTLTPPLAPNGFFRQVDISPDRAYVVYRGDQLVADKIELFSIPIEGGELPTRLNRPILVDDDILAHEISNDSQWVLALGRAEGFEELRGVPIDGSIESVSLSGPVARIQRGAWEITQNSSHVIYAADPGDGTLRLYLAPIDGSQSPIQLHGSIGGAGIVAFATAAHPQTVSRR